MFSYLSVKTPTNTSGKVAAVEMTFKIALNVNIIIFANTCMLLQEPSMASNLTT